MMGISTNHISRPRQEVLKRACGRDAQFIECRFFYGLLKDEFSQKTCKVRLQPKGTECKLIPVSRLWTVKGYNTMGVISGTTKEVLKSDGRSNPPSGYLTTTELARLCGVSRFTIINWAKQGKIKTKRTIGGHYRIPEAEALLVLKIFDEDKETNIFRPGGCRGAQKQETKNAEECGNCLTDARKGGQSSTKKKKFLYNFGYGIGRGVHILKERGQHA